MDNLRKKNKPQNDLKRPDRNEAGFNSLKNNFEDVTYNDNNRNNNENDDGKKKKKNNNLIHPNFIFGVLLILGFGTLIFGFVNLSKNIYGPKNQFEQTSNNQQVEQNNLINDLLTLQSKDTDKDGLSDYDEIYIYKTSPYLPDTDSDGYSDKEEIDGGYDPLCPKGQDCRGTGEKSSVENNKTASSTLDKSGMPQTPASGNNLPPEMVNELNKLTPEQIRKLLLDSGKMTQEQLNQIDDKTLMSIYQEVLGSQ